jgi:hypothetical protein
LGTGGKIHQWGSATKKAVIENKKIAMALLEICPEDWHCWKYIINVKLVEVESGTGKNNPPGNWAEYCISFIFNFYHSQAQQATLSATSYFSNSPSHYSPLVNKEGLKRL